MNSQHEFDRSRQLDRLVDGELSKDEYDELLAALDREPDGWRLCATAFLEAQAWQHELGTWRASSHIPDEPAVSVKSARPRNFSLSSRLAGMALATAVGFVAALGMISWQQSGSRISGTDETIATVRHDRPQLLSRPELQRPSVRNADVPSRDTAEHLTFVIDRGNGELAQFEMPVCDISDAAARRLLDNSPSLPVNTQRAIRESGFDVTSQRQWTQVQLQDGRRAYFPIDRLEITPVVEINFQ